MIDKDQILNSHPLLKVLPPADLDRLLARASIDVHPKGTVIYSEGEPCGALFTVLSGRCESKRALPGGLEKTIEIFGPGDMFGDWNLSGRGQYRTAVRVITDCILHRINSQDVQEVIGENAQRVNGEKSTARLDPAIVAGPNLPAPPGRIVTLAAMSRAIPDRLLTDKLARNLREETQDSVLVVDFSARAGTLSLTEWASVQPANSGSFRFTEYLAEEEGGYFKLSLRLTGAPYEPSFIAPLISHFGRSFRHVLLVVTAEHVGWPAALECMIQSDESLLFLAAQEDDYKQFELLNRSVRAHRRGDCSDIKPVVCLKRDQTAYEFTEQLQPGAAHIHSLIHHCPLTAAGDRVWPFDDQDEWFNRDLRRLARGIGGCMLGLALSSGGAKGLAHIGVIQVLEENGIEVDVVTGCSMGSYVAAVWACGFDGQAMEKLAREIEGRWGLLRIIDPVMPPRRGFVLGAAVRHRLERSIGDAHFSDTVRSLRIVATKFDTLERKVFCTGEVAAAVHASSAIPGVCVPVEIDGETYIDGGVTDPLPIDLLGEIGVERIIAVNTIPTPAFLKCCREMEREQAALREKGPGLTELLNRHFNYFARGNILDIMMRAVHGAQIRVAEEACLRADVVLRPLAIDARWHDFTHPGKYIALGRKVAEEHLAEIKALVKPVRRNHEIPVIAKPMAIVA